jgi:hypothetical protein
VTIRVRHVTAPQTRTIKPSDDNITDATSHGDLPSFAGLALASGSLGHVQDGAALRTVSCDLEAIPAIGIAALSSEPNEFPFFIHLIAFQSIELQYFESLYLKIPDIENIRVVFPVRSVLFRFARVEEWDIDIALVIEFVQVHHGNSRGGWVLVI